MKSKILASTLLILGFVLGATALSSIAAWTPPLSGPPNCVTGNPGCDAPIHVGSFLQNKTGPLQVNWLTTGFQDIGLSLNGKIKILDAGPYMTTANSVLTNDGTGVGTWQPAASGGSTVTPARIITHGVADISSGNFKNLGSDWKQVTISSSGGPGVSGHIYKSGNQVNVVLNVRDVYTEGLLVQNIQKCAVISETGYPSICATLNSNGDLILGHYNVQGSNNGQKIIYIKESF